MRKHLVDIIEIKDDETIILRSSETNTSFLLTAAPDYPLGICKVKIAGCDLDHIRKVINYYDIFPKKTVSHILDQDGERYFASSYTPGGTTVCIKRYYTKDKKAILKAIEAPVLTKANEIEMEM